MAILAYYEALLRRKARGAAFSITGLLFLLVGTGFLTAALWMVLSEMASPRYAAMVIGFGFVAVGFIVLGFGRLVSRLTMAPMPPRAVVGAPLVAQLVEGFLVGITAGRRTRRPRD